MNKVKDGSVKIEEQIAIAFSEILHVPLNFDRCKSFIQLGGQSIAAAKLQIRLVEMLGVRVPYATIFENGTVSELAEIIFSEEEKG